MTRPTSNRRDLPTLPALLLSICISVFVELNSHPALAQPALPGTGPDPALVLQDRLIDIIERATPGVVSIARVRPAPLRMDHTRPSATAVNQFRVNDPESQDFLPNDFGCGFLIAPEGGAEPLVLTAYHVVRGGAVTDAAAPEDGTVLYVYLSQRRFAQATIWAADPRSDLAVLKLDLRSAGLTLQSLQTLDWTTAPAVRKGQFVVVLGNPYALARDGSPSATWGMVSNLLRRPGGFLDDVQSRHPLQLLGTLMQIDTRLRLGGSGGPILDLQGRIVGLTSSIAALEGYETSAGFGFPIDAGTRRIVSTLLAGQEVEYGFLGVGVEEVGRSVLDTLQVPAHISSAAKVTTVQLGAPATALGLRTHDLITTINQQPVAGFGDLMRIVGLMAPESEIELTVYRDSQSAPLLLKGPIGKWPVREGEAIIASQRRYPPWRGLTVDYPTARADYNTDGIAEQAVLVLTVAEGSLAEEARLQPGQFISHVGRTRVKTPREFADAIQGQTGEVSLRLVGQPAVTIAAP